MTKTKSRHHKTENTHRFLTLAERLSTINVDVTKRINRLNVKPEETETYFYKGLEKWVDLNYTASFHEFTSKVKRSCQTLALLIYHKDSVIQTLVEFIARGDELSLQPILDLTAQIARDLQQDFYPYFPKIFEALCGLLNSQNTDVLEWSFQTLSYLFKFLWRYMLKDLANVYQLYSPLLSETRKKYIRNFAAESFAFIMRKATDKNELYDFLLNRLVSHPDEANGIGRLIFDMFTGVKFQFNTCTEHSFGVLLDKLACFGDSDDLVHSCISQTVESMAAHTKKEFSSVVWKCFYAAIDRSLTNTKKMVYLLDLIRVFIDQSDCYLIDDLDKLLSVLIKVGDLKSEDKNDEQFLQLTQNYMKIGQQLLVSSNVKFSIEKAGILPSKLYQAKYDLDLVCELTRNLFSYSLFETMILPEFVNYINSNLSSSKEKTCEKQFLTVLIEYLIKHKKLIDSETFLALFRTKSATESNEKKEEDSSGESIHDHYIKTKQLNHLVRLFDDAKKFTSTKLCSSLDNLFQSSLKDIDSRATLLQLFLIAPIMFRDKSSLIELRSSLIHKLVKRLSEKIKLVDEIEKDGFLISIGIWSLVVSKSSSNLTQSYLNEIVELLDALGKETCLEENYNKTIGHLIRALSLVLTELEIKSSNQIDQARTRLECVIGLIKKSLSSPYHETRLNSLCILSLYFTANKSKDDENENVFEICISGEENQATLDNYRQKLYHLQRLSPNACGKILTSQTNDVPLRFLFGVLFENFQLIWNPTVELIESYADFMKQSEFWPIFSENLLKLTDMIEFKLKENEQFEENADEFEQTRHDISELLFDSQINVDYMNARVLMFKAMQGFALLCESKTRVLVPLLFRFLENQYYTEENRLLSSKYDDLTIRYKDSQLNRKPKKDKYQNKALLNKHLCAFLEVFAKFNSPTSWFQEESLRNLYLNLLCHNDSNVQKIALSCICVYKYEFLAPYREHLEKLLDGKHFRHELVVFSIEENTGKVHADHRSRLLPILMRILYGKFHSHETTHTSSRDTKSNKGSTIIQFLSSCNEYELNYFFNLIFDCVNQMCMDEEQPLKSTDRFEFNQNILDETGRDARLAALHKKLNSDQTLFDLKRVVPFKKILGVLQSLEIIMKKMARQMEQFAHRILQIICFIHKYAINLAESIQSHDSIDEYHVNLLRLIRQKVTQRFKQFFETFDHLNFSKREYLFTFDCFIWPQASKLTSDALTSVNNLLKIFMLWSERPLFYPLFVVRSSDFSDILSGTNNQSNYLKTFENKNLLELVFELADSPKCLQVVVNYTLDIVHNLVTYADFKSDDDDLKPLPFDVNWIRDQFKNQSEEELNFGTMILKPHVTSIVNHVEKIVIANSSKKVLPVKPLKILARLSSFASNSQQQCEKIINLLIPYLIKNRRQTEENEINILDSINHLLKQVREPGDFINSLSRLFSVLSNRQSRQNLCQIFSTIAQRDEKYQLIGQLANNLNAWDPKRLEEPDFMLRLDAFKLMNETVNEWTRFDAKLASILIYNCFFFMNNIEDIAIKESSTNSVQLFIKKSSTLELDKSDKFIFEANFISELKGGLKNKNENARHEFVSVLVTFINSFSHLFTNLKEFSVLFDTSDVEKDFFENIKHIQMHRRARALSKLQRACNESLISSENLLAYMMPIVRSFLDNEMYHKYDYLIEEACNTIGAICYTLAWPKYVKLLEFYLSNLTKNILNQKLVIKVLVRILDAFHFDLSLAQKRNDYFSANKNVMPEENEEENEEDSLAASKMEVTSAYDKLEGLRRKKLVGSAQATKIHTTITKSILPMLFKCLTKKFKSDSEHKINKHEDEDEQILRVPIALAILKLLNNLPSKTLDVHLPGLLYKVCDMLKSRAISVRNTTRDCLLKMIESLPDKKYYFYVFKELSNCLTRGYQVHVLCFTIQLILKTIESRLVVGDLDSSLGLLLNSVKLELFSDVAEEKEVKQIVAKIMEAKTVSSYNTLEFIAKYVSKESLLELIKPFKEQLDTCNSRKLLKKIEEAMRRNLIGLLCNQSLSAETLMYMSYGLITDSFESLKSKKQSDEDNKKLNFDYDKVKQEMKRLEEVQSCLILPREPKRGGDKPVVLDKTNQHVLNEFSLQLLNNLMKQNRITTTDEQCNEMLDPYIPILVGYLDGKHIKVTTATLRCLLSLLKFHLPSLEKSSNQIASKLFSLLKTYSAASSTESSAAGDHLELLMICYKLISSLIRDVSTFNLDEEQLQVLLYYAERNLYDSQKQAAAFNLLKSILSRKLQCNELTDVLSKVMKLSIQADGANVRLQSRQTILQYILDYSLTEKKLVKFLEFYIVQLNYEYENGRESALEMLATIFNTFPTAQLDKFATLFFIPLAIQLHNDESAKCKKLAYLALKSLLEKISIENRDQLFNITKALFKDNEKPLHKRIAALLVKIFIEVEGKQFDRRLEQMIDIILTEIEPEKFMKSLESNTNSSVSEKFFDHYLHNLLTLVMKMLTECHVASDKKYQASLFKIFDHVKYYMSYEHSWVRLISCQIFGQLFASHSLDELCTNKSSYFFYSTEDILLKVRDLIDAFCLQLKSPILENDLAEQIVKNLAFMTKVVIKLEVKKEDAGGSLTHDFSLDWLLKKVVKEAKYELVNKPKESIKRNYIFKWLASLALEIGKDRLKEHLWLIIPILQREVTIGEPNEILKPLAHEVLELIKHVIGIEEYSLYYSKTTKKRIENKEERKRKLAQEAVTDPQRAAMKKIHKMQRKKEAKKRKMENPLKSVKPKKRRQTTTQNDDY